MTYQPIEPPTNPAKLSEYLSRELRKIELALKPTGWVQIVLSHSWVDFGASFAGAQFRKAPGGLVSLRGLIRDGSGTSGTVLTTLPEGYRPVHRMAFSALTGLRGGSTRPYIYGHGIRMREQEFAAEDAYDSAPTSIDQVANKTNIKAIMLPIFWHSLETNASTENTLVADLSIIDWAISWIEGNNYDLKIVPQIREKSFGGLGAKHYPQWVAAAGLEAEYSSGNWEPHWWNSRIVDAQVRLAQKIYDTFKNREPFIGLVHTETATGLTSAQQTQYGYTPAAYEARLIDRCQRIASGCPEMRYFFMMNFLEGGNSRLDTVNAEVAVPPYDCCITSPDILQTASGVVNVVKPRFENVTTAVPNSYRASSCQYDSYDEEKTGGGFYSPLEQKDWGRDNFNLHLIWWNRLLAPRVSGAYDVDDAYAMIASEPEDELDTYTGGIVEENAVVARIDVLPNGNVVLVDGVASSSWLSLDGITFVAEA